MKHKHHIIPKHASGTDDASNLIELTVEEHAEAHRLLYEQYGRIQDKVAYMGLMKLAPAAELIHILQTEGMQGKNNPMYGKPAPNRGIKRPGVGGRKKGTKWSEAERVIHEQLRSQDGYYDYTKDPIRNKKISDSKKGKVGPSKGKSWYNNGAHETWASECPAGYVKGRKPRAQTGKRGMKWYNNGLINRQFVPGTEDQGYVNGRITKK
jgi:hypothetical protein